jgi:hypothetical protein
VVREGSVDFGGGAEMPARLEQGHAASQVVKVQILNDSDSQLKRVFTGQLCQPLHRRAYWMNQSRICEVVFQDFSLVADFARMPVTSDGHGPKAHQFSTLSQSGARPLLDPGKIRVLGRWIALQETAAILSFCM